MVSKVFTAAPIGIDAVIVEVETSVQNGLPATNIVGLPDTAVKESRERVRSAIKSLSVDYPQTRVSVNLAPADLPKVGSQYDLPIALSILLASGETDFPVQAKLFIGELALDGRIRRVEAVLNMVMEAKQRGFTEAFVPNENIDEAQLIDGITIYGITSLQQLVQHLLGVSVIESAKPSQNKLQKQSTNYAVDFSDIKGQRGAKRALEIAIAGGHNLLMYGPPGSGKTMLAAALPSIMPPLEDSEYITLAKIYSATGGLKDKLKVNRPVRAPHHTASYAALVGGGTHALPGEITLAHSGILFLDELPEFSRKTLESLRQPMENGEVTVARSKTTITWPARFMLVGAMNPCPCGNYGENNLRCTCTQAAVNTYAKRVSGPLLDRIDLRIPVSRLEYEEISKQSQEEKSESIQTRVINARAIQSKRFKTSKTNALMNTRDIEKFCQLDEDAQEMVKLAVKKHALSARSMHRILKVARTIADLAGAKTIVKDHISEAIQYRVNQS